jgi:hypothetical protein
MVDKLSEVIVDLLSDVKVDPLSEVIETVAVRPSVFVVLAPISAPCNAKTALCV